MGKEMIEISGALIERMRYHSEPYIRYRILVDVLGKDPGSKEAGILRDETRDSVLVKTLLAERNAAGEVPLNPYDKWRGAHWILTNLADLNYPPKDKGLIPLREQVYAWLFSERREKSISSRVVDGRYCYHASQEGNTLYYLLALGLNDERTDELAKRLLTWQWPDGGWNCDTKPSASNSSFMESLIPLRSLALHAKISGNPRSRAAAERAAEIFLKRKMFKRERDGKVIKSDFTALHYPCYWHYDVLFGLKVITEAGFIHDERCTDALDLLVSKQLPDGGFPAEKKYYRVGKNDISGASLVNWGGTSGKKMNEFVTVDAFHILKASGRLTLFGR